MDRFLCKKWQLYSYGQSSSIENDADGPFWLGSQPTRTVPQLGVEGGRHAPGFLSIALHVLGPRRAGNAATLTVKVKKTVRTSELLVVFWRTVLQSLI